MRIGTIFTLSFITALSGALMPGPLLTVTIAQTAQTGFSASVLLVTGHSLLELLLVIGFVFGLGHVLKIKPVIGVISVLGGAVLLWMGWGMLRAEAALELSASGGAGILGNPVITGMAVSISNPYWVVWWATVGVTLFAALAQNPLSASKATVTVGAFYFGHILGDIVWYLAIGAAVATGRAFISPDIYRAVVQICGVFLIFLGGTFLYLVVSGRLWKIKMSADWLRR